MTAPCRILALVFLLALIVPGAGAAQTDDAAARYARLNASLVDDYAIPRYRRLDEAATAMDEAATALCAAPDAARLDAARAAFAPLVEAWAGLQHLRVHPQEMEMRAHRLQFWPDRRDMTGRRIARFLHNGDLSVLEPFRFAKSSAVLQGLPALERMLFDEDHAPKILAADDEGALRCRLLEAIAANVAGIAGDILGEWTREGGFRHSILEPASADFLFQNEREGALAFFTHFHMAIEYAVESKIADPMGGESIDDADPQYAEFRRSALSLESLIAGLDSAAQMWSGVPYGFRTLAEDRGVDPELVARVDEAFAGVAEAARAIPAPLADAVSEPEGRAAVHRLAERVRALRVLVRGELAPALGLAVGFNSADGD